MKKSIITVAIFLMLISGGHTGGHHDHVHYELPEWEVLNEPTFTTSGATHSVYRYH